MAAPLASPRGLRRETPVFPMLGTRRLCQLGFLLRKEEERVWALQSALFNVAARVLDCSVNQLLLVVVRSTGDHNLTNHRQQNLIDPLA